MKTTLIFKILWFIFLLELIFSVSIMLAGDGGSGYSRYGIGDLSFFISNRSIGMGGAGLSVASGNNIDRLNPAGLSQINRTSYSISMLYEGIFSSDEIKSGYSGGTFFDGFMIAIPISPKNGVVLSTGITPYSRIRYNIIEDSQSYSVRYLGNGGLAQGHVGISGTITNEIHLGAKLNYYTGTLNYTIRQIFNASEYSEVLRALELKGVGFTLGTIYSGLKNMIPIPEGTTLNIGAVFTTTSYLTATEEKYYSFKTSLVTSRDTTISDDFEMRLPYSLGVGMSYISERYLLSTDFYYQNWKQYTMNGVYSTDLRDSYRFSIGGELLHKRDQSIPFIQRIAYRVGLFYNSSYYNVKSKSINEIGITGGFGIPIFIDTRIDMAIEYSFRGTTDLRFQKDNILRVSFSLSGSELWFVRPEQE